MLLQRRMQGCDAARAAMMCSQCWLWCCCCSNAGAGCGKAAEYGDDLSSKNAQGAATVLPLASDRG